MDIYKGMDELDQLDESDEEESQYKYTKDDFLNSSKPYDELACYHNPFEQAQATSKMAIYAKSIGVPNFKQLLGSYYKANKVPTSEIIDVPSTIKTPDKYGGKTFTCGEWTVDDSGIRRSSFLGEEVACLHQIFPVERLVDIDTGEEKLKLAYKPGDIWRDITVSKAVLASTQKITAIAGSGIAVTSNNAKALMQYIFDFEHLNYKEIPEHKCVSRLGYIPGEGFSPYVDGVEFAGDVGYESAYKAIHSFGDCEESIKILDGCRKMSLTARLVIDAAFASTLVAPLGALPFFVHLWGTDSGTGKTVALMAAASVWGDPTMGNYIKTFNSTTVGYEKMAAFLNHLPMLLDELQLTKSSKSRQPFDVYQLAQGVGRTRGNAAGGVDRTSTWANCIITTGESPITDMASGAGAINRVLDIECKADEMVITNGAETSSAIKNNYGFLGRKFVDWLYSDKENLHFVELNYQEFFRQLTEYDTTEKQAMAAAIIMAADNVVNGLFFKESEILTANTMASFLATKSDVSAGERGYQFMCDWVAMNTNKFDPEAAEVYGVIEGGIAYINATVFRNALTDAGFSAQSVLSYLKSRELILTRGNRYDQAKRICGMVTRCIWMLLPQENGNISGDPPF
ncbi:MAG: DUF927 domain-containing protein [Coprobacillus sp.]|nr:DUF927 domain-containing protein [Coprobacillus sp.]